MYFLKFWMMITNSQASPGGGATLLSQSMFESFDLSFILKGSLELI